MLSTLKKILGIGSKVDFSELVKEGAIIVDVRTKGEYESGHIKGSVNIPVDQLQKNLHMFKNKEHPLITCCESGMRSYSAKGIFTSNGFINVRNGGSWYSLNKKLR